MKVTANENCPIFWYQGLFLHPQHFQLESRFHHCALNARIHLLHNEPWGVLSLSLHEAALAEKRIIIQQGAFLFPDGSQCHVPHNAVVSSRLFDEAWIEAGHPFVIYLGVKQWQAQENVAEIDDQVASNSTLERRMVAPLTPVTQPDCYQRGVAASVRLMKYQLRLFWHSELEQSGDYLCMPIASLERDGSRIMLNGQFIPPLLNVHDWPYLHGLLLDIRDPFIARTRQLECFKQNYQQGEPFDAALMLTLHIVIRCAWRAQLLIDTPQLHPRQAWSALTEMLAELSCLTPTLSLAGKPGVDRWPNYDHLNLTTLFTQLVTQLKQALNLIVVGPEYSLPLQREGSIWRVMLPKQAFKEQFHYWLALHNMASDSIERSERLIKLAPEQLLSTLLKRALSGLTLTAQPIKPVGLPRLTDGLYYAIASDSELWSQIDCSGQLALFWPAPEQAQATLYLTRGEHAVA